MMRHSTIAALLLLSACANEDRPEVLCAAQSLKANDISGAQPVLKEMNRARATLFIEKLNESEREAASKAAEEVARKSGWKAMIPPEECDAMLTPEEQQRIIDHLLATNSDRPF